MIFYQELSTGPGLNFQDTVPGGCSSTIDTFDEGWCPKFERGRLEAGKLEVDFC